MRVALAGGTRRGRVVGTVQAGLLVGLLASRAYSGILGKCWVAGGVRGIRAAHRGAGGAGQHAVAAARALTSPPAGRLADRIGGRSTLAIVLAIAVAGWAALALGHRELGWLVVGTVLLDVGVWSNQVVNQTMLFARDGALHSRLNTLYFSTRFLGIAAGSTLGVVNWSAYGWPQVGLVAVTCLVVAAPIACSRAVSR
ncbi:hypothetical protein [Pseudonocardia sp. GCM10023141]|uniref:hypothetical protein n=1 Tax=Pseudonocardia sp. GCM10023141 TaxID=3252653 RepID=UPI003616544C